MKSIAIAIIGYGKMGKMIASTAERRGHHIGCIIDRPEDWDHSIEQIKSCNVAIDFSIPTAAMENIKKCFELQLPVVVGTTAWYDQLQEVELLCRTLHGGLFYAPNFSLGMNAVFALNEHLAELIGDRGYHFSIREVHHIHKLDAPSGTAIKLAESFIQHQKKLKSWQIDAYGETSEDFLPIVVERTGEVNGYHEVIARSDADLIRISHEALNREGFALGAVLAAEFIYDKQGIYTMRDLLKFNSLRSV